MFVCRRCKASTFRSIQIEYYRGDWVAVCSECGAKNILAVIEINNLPTPTLQMIGWKE
jgi:hypothetical protein